MSTDDFTCADVRAICDAFNATLHAQPLRRGEAVFVVPGDAPRRLLQNELAAELRADGLGTLARKVERSPVPRGHALIVSVGVEVRLFVLPMTDLHGADA